DEILCKKFLKECIPHIKSRIEKLKIALNENDYKSMVIHAHTLKGTSVTLSAHRMYEIAYKTEEVCIERELDKVCSLVSRLEEELERFRSVLHDLFPDIFGVPDSDATSADCQDTSADSENLNIGLT
ncbi:Hpt domain-containing protein, partial [Desulfobacterales bacterium HSG2]|nr:Hpt domain-containing protein [Desulfobacterales bacterium HSG2]